MPPPFDGFIERSKRVSPPCLVILERNRFSVPAALANWVESLRADAERIVLEAEASVVTRHARVSNRGKSAGQRIYAWQRCLAVV